MKRISIRMKFCHTSLGDMLGFKRTFIGHNLPSYRAFRIAALGSKGATG